MDFAHAMNRIVAMHAKRAELLVNILSKTGDWPRERRICAEVVEELQRTEPRMIAVNEAPYWGGAKDDYISDLMVYFGDDHRTPLWVEVKPILENWLYWRPSKFFPKGIGDPPWKSSSVILDDLDKLKYVRHSDRYGPSYQFGFAQVLIFHTAGGEIVSDSTPPVARRRLTAGQILYLCERRIEHDAGKAPVVCRSKQGAHEAIGLGAVFS